MASYTIQISWEGKIQKVVMFFAIAFFLLIPVLITALLAFDQLVRLEYSSYQVSWQKDGKPNGFFWIPPESKMLGGWVIKPGSSLASNRLALVWLFTTPDWMRGDPKAIRLVRRLRILVLVWNLGMVGIIVVAAIKLLKV